MNFTEYLKSVPFIQRDVSWVCGFEIRRLVLTVATHQRVLHQCRAITVALSGRVNTDERQIPMRLGRMIAAHPLEDSEDLLLILLGNCLLDQCDHFVFLRLHIRRKLERRP